MWLWNLCKPSFWAFVFSCYLFILTQLCSGVVLIFVGKVLLSAKKFIVPQIVRKNSCHGFPLFFEQSNKTNVEMYYAKQTGALWNLKHHFLSFHIYILHKTQLRHRPRYYHKILLKISPAPVHTSTSFSSTAYFLWDLNFPLWKTLASETQDDNVLSINYNVNTIPWVRCVLLLTTLQVHFRDLNDTWTNLKLSSPSLNPV